jgi:predicted rRNA methylase YqxC with S4 and FtsJ domains
MNKPKLLDYLEGFQQLQPREMVPVGLILVEDERVHLELQDHLKKTGIPVIEMSSVPIKEILHQLANTLEQKKLLALFVNESFDARILNQLHNNITESNRLIQNGGKILLVMTKELYSQQPLGEIITSACQI